MTFELIESEETYSVYNETGWYSLTVNRTPSITSYEVIGRDGDYAPLEVEREIVEKYINEIDNRVK